MNTLRVLVVEDDPALLNMLGIEIGGWGYEVELALSGAEALRRIGSNCPDIIISDLMMPGMDGMELLKALKEHRNDCAIFFVLITGHATVTNAIGAIRAGAADVLTKPIELDRLRGMLERYLFKKRNT